MRTVSLSEARTHLSALLRDVEAGETIIVTKHGVPVATLAATPEARKPSPIEAVEALREFQRQHHVTTGDMSIKEMIEEGRR